MSMPKSFKLPWSGRGVDYSAEDITVVGEAMRQADPLTHGAYMREFEAAFSEYHAGVPSFAVASCTAALELAATLIRIKAQLLLPRPDDVQWDEDPRAELVRRLLEYELFQEVQVY